MRTSEHKKIISEHKKILGEIEQGLKSEIKALKKEINSLKGVARRKQVLERDNYTCRLCGETNNLQTHHLTPRELGGGNYSFNLICVCKACHLFLHCNPKIVMDTKRNHQDVIKRGLDRAKSEGKKLGRPSGAKDKKQRKKEGYISRWA